MFTLIVELRRRYDVVIFDSPPLLPVSDAAVLAKHADGAIVTVTAGRTRRRQLQLALETLEVASADVLGIIVTRAKSGRGATYYQREPPAGRACSDAARGPRARNRPRRRPAQHRHASGPARRGRVPANVTPTRYGEPVNSRQGPATTGPGQGADDMTTSEPARVLVVWTGNVSRSPAAQAMLATGLAAGPIQVTSAGTEAMVGAPVDERMAALLSRRSGARSGTSVPGSSTSGWSPRRTWCSR